MHARHPTDLHTTQVRRRAGLIVLASIATAFITRRIFFWRHPRQPGGIASRHRTRHDQKRRVTAHTIAQQLFEEGLEGEELFTEMWRWHDETGIETRDIFQHYKTLQHTP